MKVKKAARVVCFGVVFEKLSGVFFQRAERKLEQTLPFTVLDKKLGTEALHENEEKYERSVSDVLCATLRI